MANDVADFSDILHRSYGDPPPPMTQEEIDWLIRFFRRFGGEDG